MWWYQPAPCFFTLFGEKNMFISIIHVHQHRVTAGSKSFKVTSPRIMMWSWYPPNIQWRGINQPGRVHPGTALQDALWCELLVRTSTAPIVMPVHTLGRCWGKEGKECWHVNGASAWDIVLAADGPSWEGEGGCFAFGLLFPQQ